MSRRESLKPDLYVLARILNALYGEGPMRKTHLYHRSKVNYTEFRRYLCWMSTREFVELKRVEGVERVCLTPFGLQSLTALNSWMGQVEGVVGKRLSPL